ncbi:MAG: hypothetical protein RLY87_2112 [Chloroflexota bacterium]
MKPLHRITFLCTSAIWHPGPRARILPLATYAAARGGAVTILCLSPSGQRDQSVQSGVTVQHVAQMHVGADGRPLSGAKLWWTALRAMVAVTVAAIRTNPTIIVIAKAQPINGIAGLVAGALRGVPVVLDSDDDEAASHAHARGFVHAVLGLFERHVPKMVRTTICATHWQADRIRLGGHLQVHVVPNGVHTWHLTPPAEAVLQAFLLRHQLPTPYLVYIGNWSTHAHAVDVLIRAYARSNRRYPLVLAGSGHDACELVELADRLGISSMVRWIDTLPAEEVPLLLAGAVVSIDPVRNTDACAARCPLKIVESLAQGIPVITSQVGDRVHILGEAGIYAGAGDIDSYAAAIDMVNRHTGTRAVPHSFATQYHWDTLAAQWYAALRIDLGEASHA